MTFARPLSLCALLVVAACTGTSTSPTGTPPGPATTDTQPPPKPNMDDAENIALVPSPVETQKALEAAGIDKKLADLIVSRRFQADKNDLDDTAVRTGVVIADMLLTVKTASDEQLLTHLGQIRKGMSVLEGGKDIDGTIAELENRIKGEAIERDELLKELDELSGAVIPELEFNGKDRVVPLIQAGSWLEGANLVARAVADTDNPAAADNLLKQPAVVDYFIKYVNKEGSEKAPAAVTQKLDESLNTLKGLATKPESLTKADLETVKKVTEDVLALL